MKAATKPVLPAIPSNLIDVLKKNKSRVGTMDRFFKLLIQSAKEQQAEQGYISEALDAEIKSFIVRASKATKEMNEERMPLTRKLSEISKAFTAEENTAKSFCQQLQPFRDDRVKKLVAKQQEEERIAAYAHKKAQELSQLAADMEMDLRVEVQQLIDKLKAGIIKALATVDKENLESKRANLQKLPIDLALSTYDSINNRRVSKFGNDVKEMWSKTKDRLADKLLEHYRTEINEAKQDAMLKMGNIAEMSHENKVAELKKEQEKNALESSSALEVAGAIVDANQQAAQAELAFNSISVAEELPENRSTYKIVIEDQTTYAKIAAFWFSKCAHNVDLEKFPNKTLKSMKGDLEKLANKGEMIDGLKYEEQFKAVNRAS